MVAAAIVLCLVSCKKDGVYKPGKQVAQILTVNDETGESSPYETWTWDGNQLKSITYDYMKGHNPDTVETFTYDGKRLIASDFGNTIHADYIYDGKRLIRIEASHLSEYYQFYYNNYEFEYEGKKVSKIYHTINASLENKAMPLGMLRMLLPEPVCQQIQRDEEHDLAECTAEGTKEGSIVTRTYILTWKGSNIVRIDEEYNRETSGSSYTSVSEMTYDNNHNPFAGLNNYVRMFFENLTKDFSPNNIVTLKKASAYSDGPTNTGEDTYTYTYDSDGYPTSYLCVSNTNRISSSFHRLIEYVE